MKGKLAVFAVVLTLTPPCAAAEMDVYQELARDIAGLAARAGKATVTLVPFRELDGTESPSGRIIAERLISRLTVLRGPHVLDRSADAEAMVSGTVVNLKDGGLEVNARMVDAGTGRVLGVAMTRIERDWTESPLDEFDPWNIPLPELPAAQPPRSRDPAGAQGLAALLSAASRPSAAGWRDSVNDRGVSCERAHGKVDSMEEAMLDLKARYWAGQLKREDFSSAALTRNPGTEILNPEIRNKFYSKLRMWYEEQPVPSLTLAEVGRLSEHERKARELLEGCRE